MPQSLSKVYTHITFSTKNREPFIDDEIKDQLFEYLGGICKGLDCNPVRIGGHHDHVHILCTLSRKVTQAILLEKLKKESSKWIKTKGVKYNSFYWQHGYGIFSVNPTEVDVVVDVGIAHVATVQHHGVVQQGAIGLFDVFEVL